MNGAPGILVCDEFGSGRAFARNPTLFAVRLRKGWGTPGFLSEWIWKRGC